VLYQITGSETRTGGRDQRLQSRQTGPGAGTTRTDEGTQAQVPHNREFYPRGGEDKDSIQNPLG